MSESDLRPAPDLCDHQGMSEIEIVVPTRREAPSLSLKDAQAVADWLCDLSAEHEEEAEIREEEGEDGAAQASWAVSGTVQSIALDLLRKAKLQEQGARYWYVSWTTPEATGDAVHSRRFNDHQAAGKYAGEELRGFGYRGIRDVSVVEVIIAEGTS